MTGIEMSHCNAAIDAILTAYHSTMQSTVGEMLNPILVYGKGDTLGMDAMPEITIVNQLQKYDRHAVVITEETGLAERAYLFRADNSQRFRTVFISDPTDRSTQIASVLKGVADKSKRVSDVMRDPETLVKWELEWGSPASITGGSSAISCVRRGVPIFAVIINYVTHQLFLSCSTGNYCFDIQPEIVELDVDKIRTGGKKVFFRQMGKRHDMMKQFVTFTGKAGYSENLRDSHLMTDAELERCLHYRLPGGPLRILYLSDIQPETHPIGFILANGEKISEWIHWLPFVRFARNEVDITEPALSLHEVYQDRPWTKDGILMSTPPAYSIFQRKSPEDHRMIVNVGRFSDFDNPCRIRATLMVAPGDNHWATRVVNQYGYRQLELYGED